jgi:hypothetical protein
MSFVVATLTGAEWVGIIGAIGGLVALAQIAIIAIIREWKTDVAAKLDVIKGSVDGTATKQEAKLNVALEQLDFMTRQVHEQRQTAAVLAAQTTTPAVVVAPALVVAPPAVQPPRDAVEAPKEGR